MPKACGKSANNTWTQRVVSCVSSSTVRLFAPFNPSWRRGKAVLLPRSFRRLSTVLSTYTQELLYLLYTAFSPHSTAPITITTNEKKGK